MSILTTLQEHRKGALVARLTEASEEVVRAVLEHGKAGKLTLELTYKPKGENQLELVPKVITRPPEPDVSPGVFFGDEEGKVHRSDPRQYDIEDEIAAKRAEKETAQ